MEKKPKIIVRMKTKKIVGIAIFSIGVGALVYLYKGYYLPNKKVESMTLDQLKKETKTTPTKTPTTPKK
jgi:hypothetical protein